MARVEALPERTVALASDVIWLILIEASEGVDAGERTGAGGRFDAIPIIDGGPVIAPGKCSVPLAGRDRIGCIYASRIDEAMQIDPGVERLPVDTAAGDAVSERIQACDAQVRI